MRTPSSKYLSKQPTILKGLSLNELFFVVLSGIAAGMLSGIVLGLLVGFVAVLAISGVLLGGFAGYFVLSKVLVRLKGDSPNGFLKKKAVVRLASLGFLQNPYTDYQGVWLKSRTIKKR